MVIQGYSTEATSAYTTAPFAGFLPNATNLYARVRNSAKGGVELAAMVLFNTIYGEFIEEKTTYAEVLAAGATERSESEWNRLARYAHTVFIHGGYIIFR